MKKLFALMVAAAFAVAVGGLSQATAAEKKKPAAKTEEAAKPATDNTVKPAEPAAPAKAAEPAKKK